MRIVHRFFQATDAQALDTTTPASQISSKTKDEVRELGGDAEQHECGQVGRAIRHEGDMHEDGEPDTKEVEHIDEGMQILEGSGESDV